MTKQKFITAIIDDEVGLIESNAQASIPWWSFTKTVLAVAALKLVEQGRLELDKPIDAHNYTLRHLLQHRAGLTEYGALPAYHEAVERGDTPWSVERLLQETNANKLEYEPGQGWRYSNIGYLFVSQIIEKATGRDTGDALHHLLFDQLGLSSVRLVTTPQQLAKTIWGNTRGYDPRWVYHGLLVGSPADAVNFLHQLMTGDVLSPDLLKQMTLVHELGGPLQGRPWQTTGYGLGLMIGEVEQAGLAIGHSGGGPGSICAVYHFGNRKTPCTVASFTQGHDDSANEYETVRLANAR